MKYLVFGWGMVGKAVAKHLEESGEEFGVYDDYKKDVPRRVDPIKYSPDVVIVSPGVPPTNPLLKELYGTSRVISDVDFAYMRKGGGRWWGITGTNGKTTTTELTAHILAEAGIEAVAAGNIGLPPVALSGDEEIVVLEVSSFQLHYSSVIRFEKSLITNVAQDHLGWHGSFLSYVEAKKKIWRLTEEEGLVLLPEDLYPSYEGETEAWFFGEAPVGDVGVLRRGEEVFFYDEGEERLVGRFRGKWLKGEHNWRNLLAAVSLVITEVNAPSSLVKAVEEFSLGPHRLEELGVCRGKLFVNDSKSTNTSSTLAALRTYYPKRIALILCGDDKGLDFTHFVSAVHRYAELVVVWGGIEERLARVWEETGLPLNSLRRASSLEEAVETCLKSDCEVVLFSPSSSSFDHYSNYAERGEHFRRVFAGLCGAEEYNRSLGRG